DLEAECGRSEGGVLGVGVVGKAEVVRVRVARVRAVVENFMVCVGITAVGVRGSGRSEAGVQRVNGRLSEGHQRLCSHHGPNLSIILGVSRSRCSKGKHGPLLRVPSALATINTPSPPHHAQCALTYDIASSIIAGFGSLLTSFSNDTANDLLSATTFTDISSSINFMSNQPLNGVTFPNRQAFIAGQGPQPAIGFEVLGIDAITCNYADPSQGVVAFRWLATVGANKTGGAKGINILYVRDTQNVQQGVEGAVGWVIETVYSEFNSGVWVEEFGGSCAVPSKSA
ncbi:uncharacterized protein AB675_3897, partial [Cyphellophora attinorum]